MNRKFGFITLLSLLPLLGCAANSTNLVEGAIGFGSLHFEGGGGNVPKRVLLVSFINEDQIEFDITSANETTGSVSRIKGTAHSSREDLEILEYQGDAYPATEYIFDEGCWLSIKIGTNRKIAKILEANCESRHGEGQAFGANTLLARY